MTQPRFLRSFTTALPNRSAAFPAQFRTLHSTPLTQRDLGARFRRPPPSAATTVVPPPPETDLLVPLVPPPPIPSGPREKVVEVEGVRIPPRPIAPGDEDCCMSGCVHCVLQIFVDDTDNYNSAFDQARAKLEDKGIPRAKWPAVMDEIGGPGQEAPKMDPMVSAFAELEAKLAGKAAAPPKPPKPAIDPGVAAFMALEAKIKQKQKSEAAESVAL
ncbi:hypothetical protein CspeluHIS016_0200720 [Cutaneotrichosporon spelunceum]|uniref:Oxidoreductase-like domain-containing protein n=1 Tax=Cutaneotrichosporon spelunceum TaxID=1672016 RepID=A0AAD3TQ99_9TREE|nr:hypothetical protein CspeluHIS016_0200720 [Cutaneotrichosporon spelunceum]